MRLPLEEEGDKVGVENRLDERHNLHPPRVKVRYGLATEQGQARRTWSSAGTSSSRTATLKTSIATVWCPLPFRFRFSSSSLVRTGSASLSQRLSQASHCSSTGTASDGDSCFCRADRRVGPVYGA